MNENNIIITKKERAITLSKISSKFITASVLLAITAFFTPNFDTTNTWILTIIAVILTIVDNLIAKFIEIEKNPFAKGFMGFVLATVILYLTQFLVTTYTISWLTAIIGGLIYGVVNYIID